MGSSLRSLTRDPEKLHCDQQSIEKTIDQDILQYRCRPYERLGMELVGK